MDKNYSLIIIGGGLSGLSTGISWALNNDAATNPVLLLEKQPHTGGYVTTFKRRGYHFDTCQMFPDIKDILDYFSISIDLQRFDILLRIFRANAEKNEVQTVTVNGGPGGLHTALGDDNPDNERAAAYFLDHSRRTYRDLLRARLSPGILDFLAMLATGWNIIPNAFITFDSYLRRFGIADPSTKQVLSAFVEMCGLPANEAAALAPVAVMHSLLDGAYRPLRGFADLPRKLEDRFTELGGETRTGTAVTRIIVDNDNVAGVQVASGEVFHTGRIVTTIDPKVAMSDLVGLNVLRRIDRRYADRVDAAEMSFSTFTVSLGLSGDFDPSRYRLDAAYQLLTSGTGAFNELFQACRAGNDGLNKDLFHLGLTCHRSSADGGEGPPCMTVSSYPVCMGEWKKLRDNDRPRYLVAKEKRAALMIDIVERCLIKDLRRFIVVKDIATPATYARYSGSPDGSIYDMTPRIKNFGLNRLKTRTPVKGLFQPKFVHGVLGSLLNGIQVVDEILDGKIMGGKARTVPGPKSK